MLEAVRLARETDLEAWKTRMSKKMEPYRRGMHDEITTYYNDSRDLHEKLRAYGWSPDAGVEQAELPASVLSLAFTDAYNAKVTEIAKKHRDQNMEGTPNELVTVVTSNTSRHAKPESREDRGLRVTSEFTLEFAASNPRDPITRQKLQFFKARDDYRESGRVDGKRRVVDDRGGRDDDGRRDDQSLVLAGGSRDTRDTRYRVDTGGLAVPDTYSRRRSSDRREEGHRSRSHARRADEGHTRRQSRPPSRAPSKSRHRRGGETDRSVHRRTESEERARDRRRKRP
jgi:hypothetical protein